MASTREAPWFPPSEGKKELHVYNSITQKVVPFKTQNGNQIKWYGCGPTVYDSAHLGHARAYVTFDIIRRILADYFHYDIFYVMNITDVDDKIILRARKNYLFDQYKQGVKALPLATLVKDVRDAFTFCIEDAKLKVEDLTAKIGCVEKRYVADMQDQIKQSAIKLSNVEGELAVFEQHVASGDVSKLLDLGKGAISSHLDSKHGHEVIDNSIFKILTEKYEQEFLEDLQALGVRDVDALTRVTEYIDHIIKFVQQIISNGYGYESNGSVYFDTVAFSNAKDEVSGCCKHFYAKLKPNAVGNLELAAEGEGSLACSGEKRHPNDFALWKLSRPGEPRWTSPWGEGRPGWHIECSAMATDLLGTQFDIHTGGDDLKFPHHDNEVAQSEAYSNCHQWVNYFMHAGHLSIAGLKMSKSLKNFITIRQCLEVNSARQIRLLFLLQTWDGTMNYNDDSLKEAVSKEQNLKQFFLNIQVLERTLKPVYAVSQFWSDADRALQATFSTLQQSLHEALNDNLNYPLAMQNIFEIVSSTNKYLSECEKTSVAPKIVILRNIASYIERLLKVFGVIRDEDSKFLDQYQEKSGNSEFGVQIMDCFASFRDHIREIGKNADLKEIGALKGAMMTACDNVRDNDLPEIGIRLEDKGTNKAVWKQESKEELAKQKAEKIALAKQKQANKLATQIKNLTKTADKYTTALVRAADMFKTGGYSQWTPEGLPTHDDAGAELSKNQVKTVAKAHAQRTKENEELAAAAAAKETDTNTLVSNLKSEIATLEEELKQLEL